jgi:hypothetical protein
MSPFCQAYYSFRNRVRPLLSASKPQRENLCLLAFGLFTVGNAQLTRIAARFPLSLRVTSAAQRLERLVKNNGIDAPRAYAPVAGFILSCFAGGRLRLILDATQVNGRVWVLFVAAAYRGRALPLAWSMMEPDCRTSSSAEQMRLLDRVAAVIPSTTEVVLLGDREFCTSQLMLYCHRRNWHFCFRARRNRLLTGPDGVLTSVSKLAVQAGLAPGRRFYKTGFYVQAPGPKPVNLVSGWALESDKDEPWFLLTDLPADARVLALYRVRFHVEEMFRDFKECGFRLEQTRIRLPERISRLLLGICLAYVWLLSAGVWLTKRGFRRQIDRRRKRQLSYFQLGMRYLQHLLTRDTRLPCTLRIYTEKSEG